MLETIPMTFLDSRLLEIALMSVELSEKALSFGNSRVSSKQRADRIAVAFASRENQCSNDPGIHGPELLDRGLGDSPLLQRTRM